ncbi:MAG: glycosyltransferase family 1 protein, partial [Bacteroidota bacterium]
RIGYDAKRIFHNQTGLGNYGRDIIRILTKHSKVSAFYLFNTKKSRLETLVAMERTKIVYPMGIWKNFTSLWRLFGQWRQIKRLKLDGYHGLSGEIPIQIKRSDIPKIVTIHDLIFLSHPHFYNIWDRIIYRFKFQYAVNVANHVIAISEQTKLDIIKFFKIRAHKITVIYQGCNEAFKKEYSKEELEATRIKFGLPKEYIINVGTIQERKNVLSLVKAIKGTPYHLVLVGREKSYAAKVHQYIQKNRLTNQVIFLKGIDVNELAMTYQNATVFCYPSVCEGFGIPIIEAMYSKIPVIVTRGGCFPEAAGPDAIYIEPYDIEDIRTKLHWVFSQPEERKLIAMKGYTYVQRFSDKNVDKVLMKLYKSVL